jgi:prefoldin alpha subunit
MSSDEEQLNQLVVEVRVLEGTYNQLSARENLLERALLETKAALDAIKGLTANPEEIIIPLGGGVLIRSTTPKSDRILVNIGSNVVVDRSREEATAYLENRSKEIESSIVSVLTQRNQIAERLEADRQAVQYILSRQGQQQ